MKKNIKFIFMILMIIFAFITIMALIYGIINVNQDKGSETSDDVYTKAVNECIEQCKGYSSILEDSSEYDSALEMYIKNIEEAKSLSLKAYEAENMATYALNYFSIKSIDFEANLPSNGAVSPYTKVLEELNELKIQLSNLL